MRTAATGVSSTGVPSSLGGVTDSNAENRRRRCHMCPRKKDRKTRECNTHAECRSASSTAEMTACLTCAEGGDERPRYQ